jgi:hypothetical protein
LRRTRISIAADIACWKTNGQGRCGTARRCVSGSPPSMRADRVGHHT